MITTKESQLTPQKLFQLSLWHIFVKIKWFLLIWIVAMIFLMAQSQNYWTYPLFLVVFVIVIWLSILLNVRSKKNVSFYRKNYFEFTPEFIKTFSDDGSKSEMTWERITEAKKRKHEYLLYVGTSRFLYVPFEAFKTAQDRSDFEALLKSKNIALQE